MFAVKFFKASKNLWRAVRVFLTDDYRDICCRVGNKKIDFRAIDLFIGENMMRRIHVFFYFLQRNIAHDSWVMDRNGEAVVQIILYPHIHNDRFFLMRYFFIFI